MNYRRLKRANINVSEIGFGCMSLEGDHGINEEILHAAIDHGINYFDTADIYQNGFNEETVGRALKDHRKDVIIATKVGSEPNPNGDGWMWNPSKSYILKAVDKSLARLGTDYIDIYQLHGGTIEDEWEEAVEAMELLMEQGKIRHYGLSSIRPNVIRRFADNSQIVSNMIQYSLLDRRAEEEALPKLEANDIGVMVRGGLAKGILASKDSSNYLNYISENIDLLKDKINSFSIEKNAPGAVAIQWLLAKSAVSSIVVGMRNSEQLSGVLNAYSSEILTVEEVGILESVLPINTYSKHR